MKAEKNYGLTGNQSGEIKTNEVRHFPLCWKDSTHHTKCISPHCIQTYQDYAALEESL